ncbi:MAG: hypothetical protein H6981_09615 [Gammaproteobacteria bacterium]|nr:hypothetical protein [Gammaproteobacteria bacterium]MCP5137044.1 hypothetical protein [Gammaproteobacteria bacterium]
MEKYKIDATMRLFFAVSGTIVWLGIWLTGFPVVHWLLYVPAVFFTFAVLTGLCPGLIISRMLMGRK